MHALAVIAGKGSYPLEVIRGAKSAGVERVCAVAFRGETSREVESLADEVVWMYVGQLALFLEALNGFGVRHAVMAGQITPSNLFTARLDKDMRRLLARLPRRNADTIFGAVGQELEACGIELLPASRFMDACLAEPGLWAGTLTEQDETDIRLGLELARASAALQAGQSVAVREGMVIAVEAFEGTDRMIERAGKVGGPGCVVVKVARPGHDMRWDIPVIGTRTLRKLRKAKCRGLALEAGRAVVLEKDEVIRLAREAGLFLTVLEAE
jgi:DUF1009 family protein